MFSLSFAQAGFLALALGPHAALSFFHSVSFAPVQQCGEFSVAFSGGKPPAALPLALTVVPFNATPISISLGNSTWNTSLDVGAGIAFLPLQAGSQFVATLDDADGHSVSLVSSVMTVGPSNDTSCLPVNSQASNRFAVQTMQSSATVCDTVQVTFDPELVEAAPAVRALAPDGFSFPLQQSSVNMSLGMATYTMDLSQKHTEHVVLLLNGTSGTTESSGLLQVNSTGDGKACQHLSNSGDSSSTSSPAVFGGASTDSSIVLTSSMSSASATSASTTSSSSVTPTSLSSSSHSPSSTGSSMSSTNGYTMLEPSTSSSKSLSKGAIVAIAVVSASVVVALALAMAFWLYRHRRRTRTSGSAAAEQGMSGASVPQGSRPVTIYPELLAAAQSSVSIIRPSRKDTPSLYSGSGQLQQNGSAYVKNPAYTNPAVALINSTTRTTSPSRSLDSAPVTRSNTHSSRGTRRSIRSSRVPSSLDILSPMMSSNSLPSLPRKSLAPSRRGLGSPTSSVSSGDIAQMLDLATVYADSRESGLPPLPVFGEDVVRTSAYLAGRESARNSQLLDPEQGRALGRALASMDSAVYFPQSAASMATFATFREPPRAQLPCSPGVSPLPSPLPSGMSGISPASRSFEDQPIEAFQLLQAPRPAARR